MDFEGGRVLGLIGDCKRFLLMWICHLQLLRSGQHYRIALELEMPENQANLEAGVFMVNLTFYSTDGNFLSTSARPVSECVYVSVCVYYVC